MRFQCVNDFKSPNYGLPTPNFAQALFGVPDIAMLDLMSPLHTRKRKKSMGLRGSRSKKGLWGGGF
jgi:hypothetical protein